MITSSLVLQLNLHAKILLVNPSIFTKWLILLTQSENNNPNLDTEQVWLHCQTDFRSLNVKFQRMQNSSYSSKILICLYSELRLVVLKTCQKLPTKLQYITLN